jgi:hypothetical protein
MQRLATVRTVCDKSAYLTAVVVPPFQQVHIVFSLHEVMDASQHTLLTLCILSVAKGFAALPIHRPRYSTKRLQNRIIVQEKPRLWSYLPCSFVNLPRQIGRFMDICVTLVRCF